MKATAFRRQFFVFFACVAIAGVSPFGQQPIRTGVRTVAVYATVTDAQGRLVPDLTQEDFEIYEDGKLRPTAVFASDIQPITAVVMLDRSASMELNLPLIDRAVATFVTRLLPADKIRIGSFGERIKIDPETFTGNKEQLTRIIRTELQTQGWSPLWNAVNDSITALKDQDGRRVVLVFTDGHDRPGPMSFKNVTFMDVMNRGHKEDVMVYAVGLESRMAIRGGMSVRDMMPERPDPGLPTIAAETGGGYFELKRADDLESTFARVAEELHRQYALGFEPGKLDGKRHKLEVKVKKPGMKVRARKTYVAAKE